MENIELVKRAKKGDKEALIDLICNIRFELYKIARLRLSCDDDIEDVIQETTIKAYKNINKLKNINAFKSWIIKILINECNKIYKIKKKSNISYEELDADNFIQNNNNIEEDDVEFYYLLKGLNYDERIAIVLFYMEDYSIREISKILKANENTIKTRLHRAKNKIKNKYERGGLNG